MAETIGERVAMEWFEATPAEQQKQWLCDRIDSAVAEAVKAEREACAKMARDHADADDTACVDRYNEAAHNIADAIEARK